MSKSKNIDQTNNVLIFSSDNRNAIDVKDLRKVYTDKKAIEEMKSNKEEYL